ncbi:Uncharacterised protein [Achromobacter sp. 2789STDY5608633]|nr:Uncharacterised protein [Achromobacter sp. 2789STDY5608633]
MPWPQNSRTTEKPLASACFWMALPISPSVAPFLTCWMPFHMHSKVMSVRRRDRIDCSPTGYMRLVSPNQPSLMMVTSILRESPFFRALSPGMPWQTWWLTEVQMAPGKGG